MQTPTPEDIKEKGLTIFSDPLGWLTADIERQRRICREVTLMAGEKGSTVDAIAKCIAWLRFEIPTRYNDETLDLLPMLALRARKDDDLKSVTARLESHHKQVLSSVRDLLVSLEAAQRDAGALSPAIRKKLVTLAAQERTHLALLNAVILPIARLRLTPDDLKGLGEAMAVRRA